MLYGAYKCFKILIVIYCSLTANKFAHTNLHLWQILLQISAFFFEKFVQIAKQIAWVLLFAPLSLRKFVVPILFHLFISWVALFSYLKFSFKSCLNMGNLVQFRLAELDNMILCRILFSLKLRYLFYNASDKLDVYKFVNKNKLYHY